MISLDYTSLRRRSQGQVLITKISCKCIVISLDSITFVAFIYKHVFSTTKGATTIIIKSVLHTVYYTIYYTQYIVIYSTSGTLKICPKPTSIIRPLYIVTGTCCDCGAQFYRCHDVLVW